MMVDWQRSSKRGIDLATGQVARARQQPSPNQDARPPGSVIDTLIIHGISLPPAQFGGPFIDELFTNCLDCGGHPYFAGLEGLRVSSHLLIRRDGELVQYVPLHRRAWHAGVSSLHGRERCNDFAIGIELEGTDTVPYTDEQYACLIPLCAELMACYPEIAPGRIVGHCDVAPGRKSDPGPSFDWDRLRQGLAQYRNTAGADASE
jgi:AmpD protein